MGWLVRSCPGVSVWKTQLSSYPCPLCTATSLPAPIHPLVPRKSCRWGWVFKTLTSNSPTPVLQAYPLPGARAREQMDPARKLIPLSWCGSEQDVILSSLSWVSLVREIKSRVVLVDNFETLITSAERIAALYFWSICDDRCAYSTWEFGC